VLVVDDMCLPARAACEGRRDRQLVPRGQAGAEVRTAEPAAWCCDRPCAAPETEVQRKRFKVANCGGRRVAPARGELTTRAVPSSSGSARSRIAMSNSLTSSCDCFIQRNGYIKVAMRAQISFTSFQTQRVRRHAVFVLDAAPHVWFQPVE
jgi:hypothetical protein